MSAYAAVCVSVCCTFVWECVFSPKCSAVRQVAVCFDARGNDSHFCDQDTVRKPHNVHICQLERRQTWKNITKLTYQDKDKCNDRQTDKGARLLIDTP